MANRFLETNYYKSPYVRGLVGSLKSLYSFIICDCTPSGIWPIDLEIAGKYIGFEVTMADFEENFIKIGKAVDIGRGKYFFPDFIEHQYPKGLFENNSAHKKIISELKALNLIDEKNKVIHEKKETLLRPTLKPLLGDLLSREQGLGLGNGNGYGLGNVYGKGYAVTNAEEAILGNRIELERICMATGKDTITAEESLHKYHLHLEEKEQYPKGKKAIFAGFEKWLLNEKTFKNGKENNSTVGRKIIRDKP